MENLVGMALNRVCFLLLTKIFLSFFVIKPEQIGSRYSKSQAMRKSLSTSGSLGGPYRAQINQRSGLLQTRYGDALTMNAAFDWVDIFKI